MDDNEKKTLLPEGWQKFAKPELQKLYDDMKAKNEAAKADAVSFEQMMEARAFRLAAEEVVAHVKGETQKIKDFQEESTNEISAFPGTEAPVETETEEEAPKLETGDGAGDGGDGGAKPPVGGADDGADEHGEGDKDLDAELQELLAKVASAGMVIHVEGDTTKITKQDEEDAGLTRASWHAPQSDGGLGQAMTDDDLNARFHSIIDASSEGGTMGRQSLARLERFPAKAAALGSGSTEFNTDLIRKTPSPYIEGMSSAVGYNQRPDAKTAALCGPAETVYEIPDCVDDSRKVRSFFKRLPARRGIIEFFRSLGLADVAALDGIAEEWTDVDQDAIVEGDFTTYKQCAQIACQVPVETELHRLYSCVQVEVLMDYGNPEIVDMYMRLISAAHARAAEERLLLTIREKSIALSWAGNLGSTLSVAAALTHLAAISKFHGRLKGGRYLAIVVEGMLDKMMSIDMASSAFGAASQQSLREILGQAGIGLETVMDAADSTMMPAPFVTAFAAPGYPVDPLDVVALTTAEVYGAETYPVHLITPEDGFFFELPKIDTGLVSSPELARQNARQLFMETFEGMDKNGCAPWWYLEVTVCHNGDRAGFNTVAC